MDGPSSAPELRRLRRSRTDRVVAGVCGGLGRYLGVDPVLVRVAFVVLALAGGGGVLLYAVSWVLIPRETGDEPPGEVQPSSAEALRLIFGGALFAIGVIALLGVSFPDLWKYFWPLALIAIGIAVLIQASRR